MTATSYPKTKLTSFLLLLLVCCFGCATQEAQSEKASDVDVVAVSQSMNEPYTLHLSLEEEGKASKLVAGMELQEGSHFVSPHAKRAFKGKFGITIEDNENLELDSSFIETPRSVEEYDPHPFVDGVVNWVRVNTTYQHQLHLKTKDDFEVSGLVRFTIEPRCTLEEIPFVIAMRSGEMSVRKK